MHPAVQERLPYLNECVFKVMGKPMWFLGIQHYTPYLILSALLVGALLLLYQHREIKKHKPKQDKKTGRFLGKKKR